jgi:hypothetical protein
MSSSAEATRREPDAAARRGRLHLGVDEDDRSGLGQVANHADRLAAREDLVAALRRVVRHRESHRVVDRHRIDPT